MTTLTLDKWKNHLESEKEIKSAWKHFIQKKKNEEAVFKVLTAHHYDNFEKDKFFNPDTMQRQEKNFFEDRKMRWAYVKIREIRGGNYMKKRTVNEMISLIQAIQACQEALDTSRPVSQPRSAEDYHVRFGSDGHLHSESSAENKKKDISAIPLVAERSEEERKEALDDLYAYDPDEPRWNR